MVKRFSLCRGWFVSEEKRQRSASSVFEKTRVGHHGLQKKLLKRSGTSPIQRIDVGSPLHQPHNDTCGGQSAWCFSKDDFSVDSEVMIQPIEHLITQWQPSGSIRMGRGLPRCPIQSFNNDSLHSAVSLLRVERSRISSKTVIFGAREPTSTMN